MHFGY